MVLTGTGLSGEGGSLSEEPTPAHRGSWGQMGGSTAWPSPAHPTRSSQLPHTRHLTVEAEETAGSSAGSPDPGGGGSVPSIHGPSKKNKIPRKRDTSGYGVFVNRCLPRLITAANFPKKPAYKYEQWATDICDACVKGKYGSSAMAVEVVQVAAAVKDFLAERAMKRANNGKTYATPAEQAQVERLSQLIEQCEAESESKNTEDAILQLMAMKAGALTSADDEAGTGSATDVAAKGSAPAGCASDDPALALDQEAAGGMLTVGGPISSRQC